LSNFRPAGSTPGREWRLPCSHLSAFAAGGTPTRIGDQVKFEVRSVFFWPQDESPGALPPDAKIEGKVVGFSDSGSEPCVFAVVEIVKTQSVIVPIKELEIAEP
jgi:hypothetical protein